MRKWPLTVQPAEHLGSVFIVADDRADYLNLLGRITHAATPVYELGRQVWALSMQRAAETGDWIYHPSWLLWGALID